MKIAMLRFLPYLAIVCGFLVSCGGHQPTNIPAPDPRVERFTSDGHFVELALDQTGTPWLRSVEQGLNMDLLSSYLEQVNEISKFVGDSLVPVFSGLPGLGSMAFDRQGRLWAVSAGSLMTIDKDIFDTVYTGPGRISTLLVDIHDQVWITPDGTGIVKVSEHGQQFFTISNSGILRNTVSCSGLDRSNTKWFGHLSAGISRISDGGSVHVIDDFIDQNLYALAPGSGTYMLAGLGWKNNDTILVSIGGGPPANLSPSLEHAEFPHTKLIVADIAVDHFNRTWIVVSHVEDMATVKMELYFHNLEWHKLELIPGEEIIASLEADLRHGIVYVLTDKTLYRIR
jgi:hypothetical protein